MQRVYTAVFRPWTPGYAWFGRDSGLVTEGLRQIGQDSRLVILRTDGMKEDERFLPATAAQFCDQAFWSSLKLDAVVLQGGGEAATQPVADAIRASGTKLFYRMDTDGIVDPRINPRLFAYGKWWSSANRFRVRYVLWEEIAWANEAARGSTQSDRPVTMGTTLARERALLTIRTLMRPMQVAAVCGAKLLLPEAFGAKRVGARLAKADAIFVESNIAAARLQRLLYFCGLEEASHRICVLPIPIPDAQSHATGERRDKIVITAGRLYDDQKDAKTFIKLVARFLAMRKDYRAVAIGDGHRYVRSLVDRHARKVADRIEVIGRSSPEFIRAREQQSRIFVCTSRGESMHIASAEAVMAGCSVVGPTEIASMHEYTSQKSGTLAATRKVGDMLDALLTEANAWDAGSRDPEAIGNFFAERFSPLSHARQLLAICSTGMRTNT